MANDYVIWSVKNPDNVRIILDDGIKMIPPAAPANVQALQLLSPLKKITLPGYILPAGLDIDEVRKQLTVNGCFAYVAGVAVQFGQPRSVPVPKAKKR